MEERLELKHLAPYLPYGLKLQDSFSNEIEMVGIAIDQKRDTLMIQKCCKKSNDEWYTKVKKMNLDYDSKQEILKSKIKSMVFPFASALKPLLRPLSQLNTLGNKDVPINEHTINELLVEKHGCEYGVFSHYKNQLTIELDGDSDLQYDANKSISFDAMLTIQKELSKGHYDYMGLIPKGLALEKTLKEQEG